MIKIDIQNETAKLREVVVGIATDFDMPTLENCYDPKSRENLMIGTFPKEKDCVQEMEELVGVLKKYGVKVHRPVNIKGLNQIFCRDIAFVIEDKIVVPNIIEDRAEEINALVDVLNQIDSSQKIHMPDDARIEGGDVIVWNDYIFIGYSKPEDFLQYKVARTNIAGVDFIKKNFPNKQIKSFELRKSDTEAKENALHLDCCFQPIGKDCAILYKEGFKNQEDAEFLERFFKKTNIILIDKEEMYQMNSNVFSVSENVIISEKGFNRLNTVLREKGFIVEEIAYSEIAKMEGLLRCSTLPLIRN